MKRTRQVWAVAVGSVAAVVLLPLAAAWACTSLATLNVTPKAGSSGETVTAVGNGFGRITATNGNTPVEIRWGSSTGPLLATVVPSAQSTINFSFVAPAGDPGYYTIIAIQRNGAGNPVGGTPARATFALNNPPAQAINGAGGATTVDQQAAIEAPAPVAYAAPTPVADQSATPAPAPAPAAAPAVATAAPVQPVTPAPAAAAPAAAAPRPVEIAPSQPLAPIPPSDARSRDILAPAGVESFLGGPGLVLVVIGGMALAVAALAAALAPKRSTARAARRTR